MSTILSYELDGMFYQIHIPADYTFDRSGHGAAVFRDSNGTEISISLTAGRSAALEPGNAGYIEGFRSAADLKACDAAVPPQITIVVLEGRLGEHATIFRGNGVISAVRNNGRYRITDFRGNTGVQYGDGNSQTFNF